MVNVEFAKILQIKNNYGLFIKWYTYKFFFKFHGKFELLFSDDLNLAPNDCCSRVRSLNFFVKLQWDTFYLNWFWTGLIRKISISIYILIKFSLKDANDQDSFITFDSFFTFSYLANSISIGTLFTKASIYDQTVFFLHKIRYWWLLSFI